MASNDYKVAIIGHEEVVSIFRATGASVFKAENGTEALEALKTIKRDTESTDKDRFAAVMIIDKLVKEIPEEEYQKVTRGALPAVIAIPGIDGGSGEGLRKIRMLSERAVGMNILDA